MNADAEREDNECIPTEEQIQYTIMTNVNLPNSLKRCHSVDKCSQKRSWSGIPCGPLLRNKKFMA